MARPGGPRRLLDLEDGTTYLAFIEAVLREFPEAAEALDQLYAESRKAAAVAVPVTAAARDERNSQIQTALRLFGAS